MWFVVPMIAARKGSLCQGSSQKSLISDREVVCFRIFSPPVKSGSEEPDLTAPSSEGALGAVQNRTENYNLNYQKKKTTPEKFRGGSICN